MNQNPFEKFCAELQCEKLINDCIRRKQRKLNKKQEKIIKKVPRLAVSYASKVLKKRWFDAEIYIAASSEYMYRYAISVCNGKLPEILHNKMLVLAMNNDKYAKSYFDAIFYLDR